MPVSFAPRMLDLTVPFQFEFEFAIEFSQPRHLHRPSSHARLLHAKPETVHLIIMSCQEHSRHLDVTTTRVRWVPVVLRFPRLRGIGAQPIISFPFAPGRIGTGSSGIALVCCGGVLSVASARSSLAGFLVHHGWPGVLGARACKNKPDS